MQEKIWVVVKQNDGEVESALAFDHEADARHFANEMTAMGKGTNSVLQTTVSRRSENEDSIAHIEIPEFDAKCIEHIVDISHVTEAKQEAAAKYLEAHRGDLAKSAQEMVDDYIKKTLTEFIAGDRVILG